MNKRVLTGLTIGGLILFCLYAGNVYTSRLLLALAILGAYELSKILRPKPTHVVYLHIMLGVVPYIALKLWGSSFDGLYEALVYISVLVSLILIYGLYSKAPLPYRKWSYALVLFYWGLSFSLGAYFVLHGDIEISLVALGIMLLIWTSDTMAYFTGSKWGKTKLFESVSPNKTWEGSIGAGISSVIVSLIFAFVLDHSLLQWIIIGVVVWITGTYGDLVESKIKRVANVKDSSNLLPGHGGFLDRFDSLAMVIPFLLLLQLVAS